jgi:hypothetical protein
LYAQIGENYMAVILQAKHETFDVVLSCDSALDVTEQEWELYKETLDEVHLKFKEGESPTRFVMRKVLPYGLAKKVQNEQATLDDSKNMRVNLGFINEEVKAALIDIKNPPGIDPDKMLKFEKDKDGTASEKLMELLIASGIVMELYSARQVKISSQAAYLKKK